MSRVLAQIFELDDVTLSHLVGDWERRAGRPAHDVRMMSDIRVRSRRATQKLGIDPDDSRAQEVYFALLEKARRDNTVLAEQIGVMGEDTPEQLVEKILVWVSQQPIDDTVWTVKTSVIKQLLKKHPPKQVMKALGLRSVDSLLKRNNPGEILPLAFGIEKPDWSKKFKGSYKQLGVVDFDARPIAVHIVSSERLSKFAKTHYPVSRIITPCYELGALLVTPPKTRFVGDTLAVSTALIEAMVELRRHSAFYRILSVRPDFGKMFAEVATLGLRATSNKISSIGWSGFQKHLVGNQEFFGAFESPHVSADDMAVSRATHVLARASPELDFWQDLGHVFFVEPNQPPVSMHVMDVVTNLSNRADRASAATIYGRAQLWDELWNSYLAHEHIANQVAKEFLSSEASEYTKA